MIPYEDGLWTLLQPKGSVAPKALLLALPSLLFTILLYFVDRDISLEKISIGDVTVSQDEGLNCTLFCTRSVHGPYPSGVVRLDCDAQYSDRISNSTGPRPLLGRPECSQIQNLVLQLVLCFPARHKFASPDARRVF